MYSRPVRDTVVTPLLSPRVSQSVTMDTTGCPWLGLGQTARDLRPVTTMDHTTSHAILRAASTSVSGMAHTVWKTVNS